MLIRTIEVKVILVLPHYVKICTPVSFTCSNYKTMCECKINLKWHNLSYPLKLLTTELNSVLQ